MPRKEEKKQKAHKSDFIGHICILMDFVLELMEYLQGISFVEDCARHEIKGYWNNFSLVFVIMCS